ncbi:hypothetical protein HZC34_02810 [Candidatus Saganbacteria bacterium]|nr:hypothetical protein [Candidatus Saganbacteria bacterium]
MAEIIIDSAPEKYRKCFRVGDAHDGKTGYDGKINDENEARKAAACFRAESPSDYRDILDYFEKSGYALLDLREKVVEKAAETPAADTIEEKAKKAIADLNSENNEIAMNAIKNLREILKIGLKIGIKEELQKAIITALLQKLGSVDKNVQKTVLQVLEDINYEQSPNRLGTQIFDAISAFGRNIILLKADKELFGGDRDSLKDGALDTSLSISLKIIKANPDAETRGKIVGFFGYAVEKYDGLDFRSANALELTAIILKSVFDVLENAREHDYGFESEKKILGRLIASNLPKEEKGKLAGAIINILQKKKAVDVCIFSLAKLAASFDVGAHDKMKIYGAAKALFGDKEFRKKAVEVLKELLTSEEFPKNEKQDIVKLFFDSLEKKDNDYSDKDYGILTIAADFVENENPVGLKVEIVKRSLKLDLNRYSIEMIAGILSAAIASDMPLDNRKQYTALLLKNINGPAIKDPPATDYKKALRMFLSASVFAKLLESELPEDLPQGLQDKINGALYRFVLINRSLRFNWSKDLHTKYVLRDLSPELISELFYPIFVPILCGTNWEIEYSDLEKALKEKLGASDVSSKNKKAIEKILDIKNGLDAPEVVSVRKTGVAGKSAGSAKFLAIFEFSDIPKGAVFAQAVLGSNEDFDGWAQGKGKILNGKATIPVWLDERTETINCFVVFFDAKGKYVGMSENFELENPENK